MSRRESTGPDHELREIVGSVRRRWRLRLLLRGAAIVAAAGFLLFFASALGIDRLRFDPGVVTAFRILLWAGIAVLLGWFVLRPLLRRVSHEQVALYLEEHEPSLRSAFLAAVEADRRGARNDGLDGRLLRVAVERARAVERGRRIERDGLRRSSAWLAGIGAAVSLAVLFGPSFQWTAGSLLVGPWRTVDAANPYAIDVEPGDVLIARGSDQRILAVPRGFETDEVEIAVRRGEAQEWDRVAMTPTEDGTEFEIILFDLDEPADYAIESEGVRSGVYRIEVADLPYVDRIDLEYVFPAWTGLESRTVEDGGDVAALRGTEVRLRVTPTLATPGARLVFEGSVIPLAADDGEGEGRQAFTGAFTVEVETFYHVELEGPDGRWVVASPDFLVEPLDDQPPGVEIVQPGRDRAASPIEEVFVEVEAEDDYGIGVVQLRYAVNGAEEQSVTLHGTRRGGISELSRGHTFFLEEFGLEPGDVIAYYARATDLGRGTREAKSDIYFLEIRPFDRDYRQAEQDGGMPGGGAEGLGGELSEQQRRIVAATFRLVRDPDDFPGGELAENRATLTLLQGRLREQVATLIEQMRLRGVAADSTFRRIFEELPLAERAMAEAESRLAEGELEEAMSPEQRALQHLLRAEAAFRDVRIALGDQAAGAGGGSPETDELADLFELEMDKLRNQYESVRRGEQQRRDEQVDEALQKLEELARRQQQMNERAAARPQDAGAGGSGQEQLVEETEELARRLERLSREDESPELRESARELREAADRMRRAEAGGRAGQGQAEAERALERLREARRRLEHRRTSAAERDVDDALARAERLLERQRDIEDEARAMARSGDEERIRGLYERKDELAQEVEALERDLDRLARESRREQPEAARALAAAADSIRRSRLDDMIRHSKSLYGRQSPVAVESFERQITADTEGLRDRVARARRAFDESDPRRLERQLDEARDLVRGLESTRERLRQRREGAEEERQPEDGELPGSGVQPGRPGAGQVAGGEGGGAGFGRSTADGGSPMTSEEVRQFQREFARRRDEAAGLRGELREEGVEVDDLSVAIGALDRLADMDDFDDPAEVERLQEQVLRGLKDFEFMLRRGLTPELERLFLSGSDRVPAEYRELVEEYYRSLSEGR